MNSEKQIDLLIKECEDAGLNIYEVLRHAKVPHDTAQNWKRSEPKTLVTLGKIKTAIEELKAEKNAAV